MSFRAATATVVLLQQAIVTGLLVVACCVPALADELPFEGDPPPPLLQPPPALSDDDDAPVDEPARAADDDDDDDDEIAPWDPGVPLWSAAGCVAGGVLGPVLPLAVAIPTAIYIGNNPGTVPIEDPGCASLAAVLTCAGFGVASIAPCSALGGTLAATTAAYANDRSVWRPLLGGVPGILCAVLSPLSCLCFPLPLGSVFTIVGLGFGLLGGPIAVTGASVVDAQVVERVWSFFEGDADEVADEDSDARDDDAMHY